jgi:rubrerythrin
MAGARLGAKALASGLDVALEEVSKGAKNAAREVDRRIARARQRLENVIDEPCEHCGWRHTGTCWTTPCPDCGMMHTGDVECRPTRRRGGGRGNQSGSR